jgi:xylan 1,4-beta-xylosidase
MSLTTHRYLRVDFGTNALLADSPGPEPNGPEGVRFDWKQIGALGHPVSTAPAQ